MSRRLVARVFVVSALLLVTTLATPVGAVQPAALSANARACKGGGWRSLSDAQGRPFRNQGQCVAFMVRHPVSLADLAGSYFGSPPSFVVDGGTCVGAGFFFLKFDTTYSGSAAVGTASLHFEGCARLIPPGPPNTFTPGTFRISTNVGSVSGTADGSVTVTIDQDIDVTVDLSLVLMVTSGTGAFSTTTGTLLFTQHWPPLGAVTGTVSA